MKMNIFNTVKVPKHKYSRFNLTHDHKTSVKIGHLVPVRLQEAVPGDQFDVGVQAMLRCAPVLAPVMHRVNVEFHHFFVPNRLLWSNWEDFIAGEGDHEFPYVQRSSEMNGNSLGNYMGIPPDVPTGTQLNALPLAAYHLIFDEWYRDQNLVTETFTPLVDGDNNAAYQASISDAPLSRAWEHDYFTSCLPFAQKGEPVTLPLIQGDDVPVELIDAPQPSTLPTLEDGFGNVDPNKDIVSNASGQVAEGTGNAGRWIDPNGSLVVDINEEATDITTLRRAFKLQEFLELMARVGSRYKEMLFAFFGVKSSDARLDRPEYIGGHKDNVVFSEVLSTSEGFMATEGGGGDLTNYNVGYAGGHGISVVGSGQNNHFAEEHGYYITIMNVQPETAYQQGLERHWSYNDRLDFFWKQFEHIGEQAVMNQEIYAQSADPTGTFGYNPRYSHYKYKSNVVSGVFRDALSFYHFGRIFDSEPALNADFITCSPEDNERPYAVWSTNPAAQAEQFYCHIIFHINARRRMSLYSVPSL